MPYLGLSQVSYFLLMFTHVYVVLFADPDFEENENLPFKTRNQDVPCHNTDTPIADQFTEWLNPILRETQILEQGNCSMAVVSTAIV
ncbi:MAG: hypothetical protein F6K30_01695 [Cyanothece sp. SIO2G6]|nr:hypothetical protein [Cyanothece sp. SIO2G6]